MSEETFSDFKGSFSYGSRTDLSFKFLGSMSDEDGAEFFQLLLEKLGKTIDDGDISRLIEHVTAGQETAYNKATNWTYDESPFTAPEKPVNQMNIGLLTSTGHFVQGDDPEPLGVKNMSQKEATDRIQDFLKAAPDLSEIPLDVPKDQLMVRHGGYDIRGVQADANVALPIDHMLELQTEGVIGAAVSPAFSFIGAAAQRRILSKTGPEWVEIFKQRNIEGAVLVPV